MQAAFVDFDANRHGFLPFTEIHPDYFKIPVSDQKKLKDLLSKENKGLEDLNGPETESDKDISDNDENKIINKNFKEKKSENKRLFFNFLKI